jgi:hypothetical protein
MVKEWRKLREEMSKKNSDPQRIRNEFESRLNSPDKKDYAILDLIVFGWGNCFGNGVFLVGLLCLLGGSRNFFDNGLFFVGLVCFLRVRAFLWQWCFCLWVWYVFFYDLLYFFALINVNVINVTALIALILINAFFIKMFYYF